MVKILTQEYLKSILHYNPETGIFIRLFAKKRTDLLNKEAGCIQNHGYRAILINGRSYLSHRLAWLYMKGEWPQAELDHINHNRTDNRWNNLRQITQQHNKKNQTMNGNNKSGITGVSWYKQTNKWRAQIRHNGKKINLGYFNSIDDAAKARQTANVKYDYYINHGKTKELIECNN